ncbi:hypothetical protein M0805_004122 [Coniferiporia weirii]|nr:hypothetical protein M0805_004122 [Coniferiporia weirii]
MDLLPTEIYLRILSELPLDSSGARTLARCGTSGKCMLRAASTDKTLWKRHYENYYRHADPTRENGRRSRLDDDWRQMYSERRQQDISALQHLQVIMKTVFSQTRVDHARKIVVLGRDVWDALTEEVARPPPVLFQDEKDIEKIKTGSSLTNLTRKYWASELLNIIARRDAIERWSTLTEYERNGGGNPLPFEQAFATLSSFHGILPEKIMSDVNSIAELCRQHLEKEGISYIPGAEGFDTPKLCIAICAFMRSQGLDRASPDQFYDFHNSLPHSFLSDRRRSLPISLVFVFVSIAKRLGLQASPLDVPNCVIAVVRGTIVDVSNAEVHPILRTSEEFNDSIFSVPNQARLTTSLLERAARNIEVAAFHSELGLPSYSSYEVLQARYMAQCISVFFSDRVASSLRNFFFLRKDFLLLDFELVIRDRLALNSLVNSEFFREVNSEIDRSERGAVTSALMTRAESWYSDRMFIGQLVNAPNGTLCCVVGWKPGNARYYSLLGIHKHYHEVHEDHLTPIVSCKPDVFRLLLTNPVLGQFFEDAEFVESSGASGEGRGRFITNDRLRQLYPEEDEYGSRWVRGDEI